MQINAKPVGIPAHVKSLHLTLDDERFKDVLAVKFIGHDEIIGYSNLWGDEQRVDVEREFFTRETDFWDAQLKSLTRPLTWDHGMDPATKAEPLLGSLIEFGDDDVGRWYHAQVNRAQKYFRAVEKLIGDRVLGSSSDSAPQYVLREKKSSGAVWLKRWPLFGVALTATPAEPRMLSTVHFKSLGLDLPQFAEAAPEVSRELPADLVREAQLLRLRIG